jgi:CHASE3 domain sensor protein
VERRRVALDELGTSHGGPVARIVALLTRSRLLTVSAGAVEFAHEALLREWPRLQGWIEHDRDGLRMQRSLTAGALEWHRLDQDEGALYRGSRLDEALRWQRESGAALSELEQRFLTASHACEQRAVLTARRGARRLRALAIGLAGLTVVVAMLAWWAIGQRDHARAQVAHATALALENSVITMGFGVSRTVDTGDQMALDAVARALRTYPMQRDDLLRLTLDDPVKHRRVQSINHAIDDYAARWARPLVALARDDGRPGALQNFVLYVKAEVGQSQLDSIRRGFAHLFEHP